MTIKQNQKIKIIPENIKQISTGTIISVEKDFFVAEINSNPESIDFAEAEIHISDENFILIFNTQIIKREKNQVSFKIPEKYNYTQKREYPRISTSIPLKINNTEEKKEVYGQIVNLGGGGMKICSPVNYNPDSVLNANFTLPNKTTVKTLFYTLRSEIFPEAQEIYAVSGQFKNISTIEKTAIIQFCFKQKLEHSGLKQDFHKKTTFF